MKLEIELTPEQENDIKEAIGCKIDEEKDNRFLKALNAWYDDTTKLNLEIDKSMDEAYITPRENVCMSSCEVKGLLDLLEEFPNIEIRIDTSDSQWEVEIVYTYYA